MAHLSDQIRDSTDLLAYRESSGSKKKAARVGGLSEFPLFDGSICDQLLTSLRVLDSFMLFMRAFHRVPRSLHFFPSFLNLAV